MDSIEYVAEVDEGQSHLLPEAQRTFRIPRGKGLPGQSNVWYANVTNSSSTKLVADLRKLIGDGGKEKKSSPSLGQTGRSAKSPDKDLILMVEKAAVAFVWNYYLGQNYVIRSVEKDNRGWDLEATKGARVLKLEVKGHAGQTIQFELTPNEYRMMRLHSDSYRVCVVRDALGSPDLAVFRPVESAGKWRLICKTTGEEVTLLEKVGARAVRTN